MYLHILILTFFFFNVKSDNLIPDKITQNVVQVLDSEGTTLFPSTYSWIGPLVSNEKEEFQKELIVALYKSKDDCHIKNCEDISGKIAVFDTNPFTTLLCAPTTIAYYLQRCGVSGALLYKKDLEKKTSGWAESNEIVSAWVEQSFMDYVTPRLENGTVIQVRFKTASTKVISLRDKYIRTLQAYTISTAIAFGFLFLWTNYHLVLKVSDAFKLGSSQSSSNTGGKKQSSSNSLLSTLEILWQEKSLLLLCYVCLWLVTLERSLYHAIDWSGYRGWYSAVPREVIDTIANGIIVSIYTLIITSWAEIAKPQYTRTKVTLKMICLIFNIILFIYLITATLIGTLSGDNGPSNYFLAACSLLLLMLFIVFGSKILVAFKRVSKLNSSQRQLKKITSFTLVSCITALFLLFALILGQILVVESDSLPFYYVYRILEVLLFCNILVILRIPRQRSSSTSMESAARTETERPKDTEELVPV